MRSVFFPKKKLSTRKSDAIERRESGLAAREEELKKKSSEIARLSEERVQELERISGLTSEQAKEYLLKTVEDEVKHDTAKLYQRAGSQSKRRSWQEGKRVCCHSHSEVRSRSCG